MAEFWRSTALPHLEARRSCQENTCYRPHTHDSFSIGVIDAGTSVLTGPLDGTIRLEPGDVVVIPAGQVHACNPDAGRWLYQMVHMDQNWAVSLAPCKGASRQFDGIRVLRRPDLHRRVSVLNDAIFTDEAREPIEAQFAALFAELEAASPAHLATSDADPELLARLAPVMRRLRHAESNPALGELAGMVGMTKYQLVRAMRRATGLSPLAWRQNARIVQARRMLRGGRPIAETAHALGFTDQSHFHRVFRAHVAASPGTYRG
ncbi:AraC family transcriptional regulator [Prauserella endophytica]|uniref:Helix-turn-helix domain-containing protein n=1 Tax=Prauserella endophytica TaxID=1592324 RepID=A0ABY2SB70_9PSEU|nr:helix-turn-helix domain-containing protein [Prauserella endophytica]TKG73132.1 helix-turn-helix domain-containing protein [Prauserella endophytica]